MKKKIKEEQNPEWENRLCKECMYSNPIEEDTNKDCEDEYILYKCIYCQWRILRSKKACKKYKAK